MLESKKFHLRGGPQDPTPQQMLVVFDQINAPAYLITLKDVETGAIITWVTSDWQFSLKQWFMVDKEAEQYFPDSYYTFVGAFLGKSKYLLAVDMDMTEIFPDEPLIQLRGIVSFTTVDAPVDDVTFTEVDIHSYEGII
jgi:hypothetical protein